MFKKRMLKSKIGLMILSLFLIIGTVSALEVKKTEFVINTEPYQNLSISVVDPDTESEVELYEGRARKFGNFTFTYHGTVDKVSLHASILDAPGGQSIKNEIFGPYTLGSSRVDVNFYFVPQVTETSDVEAVEEELELNASTEEETSEEGSSVTGLAVEGSPSSGFSNLYYYVGAAVLGVLILVFVLRNKLSLVTSSPKEPNPKKIVDKKKPEKTEISAQDVSVKEKSQESINDTEKRIADLQKQLEQIRSEEKLVKLEKQINQEKQSLKKLREEANPEKTQNLNNQNQQNNLG